MSHVHKGCGSHGSQSSRESSLMLRSPKGPVLPLPLFFLRSSKPPKGKALKLKINSWNLQHLTSGVKIWSYHLYIHSYIIHILHSYILQRNILWISETLPLLHHCKNIKPGPADASMSFSDKALPVPPQGLDCHQRFASMAPVSKFFVFEIGTFTEVAFVHLSALVFHRVLNGWPLSDSGLIFNCSLELIPKVLWSLGTTLWLQRSGLYRDWTSHSSCLKNHVLILAWNPLPTPLQAVLRSHSLSMLRAPSMAWQSCWANRKALHILSCPMIRKMSQQSIAKYSAVWQNAVWHKSTKLDDGWPENAEEHVTLVLF